MHTDLVCDGRAPVITKRYNAHEVYVCVRACVRVCSETNLVRARVCLVMLCVGRMLFVPQPYGGTGPRAQTAVAPAVRATANALVVVAPCSTALVVMSHAVQYAVLKHAPRDMGARA